MPSCVRFTTSGLDKTASTIGLDTANVLVPPDTFEADDLGN